MKLFRRTPDVDALAAMANEIGTVRRIMDRTGAKEPPAFGAPTRCPECGEWGLVDGSTNHATFHHCYLCNEEWIVTRRAINAVAADIADRQADHAATTDAGVLRMPSAEAKSNHPSNPSWSPGDRSTWPTPVATRVVIVDEATPPAPRLRLAAVDGVRLDALSA